MAFYDDTKESHNNDNQNEILWVDQSTNIDGDIIKENGFKFILFNSTKVCLDYISKHPRKSSIKGVITSSMRHKGNDLDGLQMLSKIRSEWSNTDKPIMAVVTGSITQQECDDNGVDILCNFHEMENVREEVQRRIIKTINSKTNHPEILWVDTDKSIKGDIIKENGYKLMLFNNTADGIRYVDEHKHKESIKGIITSSMRNKDNDLDGIQMINKINSEWRTNKTPVTAVVTNSISQHECDANGIDILCSSQTMVNAREQVQRKIITKINSNASGRNRNTEIYQRAKARYKKEGKPVIMDRKNVLDDIKQNADNYKNVALPMTLAHDKPFSEWDEQQFKQDFSAKFDIPIGCIVIVSVTAGSCIIDLKLTTHANGSKLLMPIEAIADRISTEKAKKDLVEFGIFAMEFGEVKPGFDITRQRVIMNSEWDRAYGPGYTNWDGPLSDGKSRGGEPYYCPKGWKRFAIQFEEAMYDFDNVYDDWPIAYHGTKFDFSMMITLSGLKMTRGEHGYGVYTSPSIRYCSHPRYARPFKLDLSGAQQQKWTQEYIDEFKKYDGKWIQVIFMLRVKPGSYRKEKETMSYWTDFPVENGKFDHIDVSEIEWIVSGTGHNGILGPETLLIYGIMIRALDKEITGYTDDQYIG